MPYKNGLLGDSNRGYAQVGSPFAAFAVAHIFTQSTALRSFVSRGTTECSSRGFASSGVVTDIGIPRW